MARIGYSWTLIVMVWGLLQATPSASQPVAGAPPTQRGYSPSVLAESPYLSTQRVRSAGAPAPFTRAPAPPTQFARTEPVNEPAPPRPVESQPVTPRRAPWNGSPYSPVGASEPLPGTPLNSRATPAERSSTAAEPNATPAIEPAQPQPQTTPLQPPANDSPKTGADGGGQNNTNGANQGRDDDNRHFAPVEIVPGVAMPPYPPFNPGPIPPYPDWLHHYYPKWRVRADNVWLKRDLPNQIPIVRVIRTNNEPQIREIDELSFPMEPGLRVVLNRAIYDGMEYVEFSYMGLHDWTTRTVFTPEPPIQTVLDITNFNLGPVSRAEIDYGSSYHTVEANLRYYLSPTFSYIVGLRYAHWDENLNIRQQGFLGGVSVEAVRRIATGNELIGLQLGGDWLHKLTHEWRLGFMGRAAATANVSEAKIDQYLNQGPGSISRRDRDDTYRLAGYFEVGAFLHYDLAPNVSLRGGYQMASFVGVALAPNQQAPSILNPREAMQFDFRNGNLLHGPFAGVEIRWGGY